MYPLADACNNEVFSFEGELIPGRADEESITEQEIALLVQRFLESTGSNVFPEVALRLFSGRPDLISTRNGVCSVFECKTRLTFGLVAQATAWHRAQERDCGMPHLIWLVVGSTRSRSSYAEDGLLWQVIGQHSLGVLEVHKRPRVICSGGAQGENIFMPLYTLRIIRCARVQPGSRKSAHLIISKLNPDSKIATPGSRGGQTLYMTDFKRTTIKMAILMRDGQPRSLQDIVRTISTRGGHHYSSDASAIAALRQHMGRLGYQKIEGVPVRYSLSSERADKFLAAHKAN